MTINEAEMLVRENRQRANGKSAVGFGGKTLKEMLDEKDRLTRETGHYYGLKDLALNDEDPLMLTRFHARLSNACIMARETAKWMAGSPTLRSFGEALWLYAGPEGDVVAASLGLQGHVGTVPWIIRSMIEDDFEGRSKIRDGDIFFCNSPRFGAGHPADCYNLVPVFHEEELVGWAVGLNHIGDIGATTNPGAMASISPTVFSDGFVYPPIKIGDNFETAQWWEELWKSKTRLGTINILDDKARTAGSMIVREKILEIIDEFGVGYYRQGLREIMERERRNIERTIRTETVPGIYSEAMVRPTFQKGLVWWLPVADRDWIAHMPFELEIRADGSLALDLEGTNTEDYSSYNCWIGPIWAALSWWYIPHLLRDTASVNTAMLYQLQDVNLPLGSAVNPANPHVGQNNAVTQASRFDSGLNSLWCRPRYARGIVEECRQSDLAFNMTGVGGTLENGVRWAFTDFGLTGVMGTGAGPYRDGETWTGFVANPQSDGGEVEEWDLYQPPLPTICKGVVINGCGHGKFRGGNSMFGLQLVYRPGQEMIVSTITGHSTGAAPSFICGASGGYPGLNGFTVVFRDTNMMDLIANGEGYPRDPQELWRWIDEGKLVVGSIVSSNGDLPAVEVQEGDLLLFVGGGQSGWGDPLDRHVDLIEEDLNEGFIITPEVARTVYGAAAESADGRWRVDEAASDRLRDEMRKRRRERAMPFKQWWQGERERLVEKDHSAIITDLHRELLKWEKSRKKLTGTWQLGEDYEL